MTEPIIVQDRFFYAGKHSGNWPFSYDAKLTEVVAWLNAKLLEIPEQYRDEAYCEISSESGYEGDHYPSIEITYARPETDAERDDRLARISARKAEEIGYARAVLARHGEQP